MSTEDLDEYCAKIEKSLRRARNKDLGIEEVDTKVRAMLSSGIGAAHV
jgi:hypothetical protein